MLHEFKLPLLLCFAFLWILLGLLIWQSPKKLRVLLFHFFLQLFYSEYFILKFESGHDNIWLKSWVFAAVGHVFLTMGLIALPWLQKWGVMEK